jgi:hypothetical protein
MANSHRLSLIALKNTAHQHRQQDQEQQEQHVGHWDEGYVSGRTMEI